MRKGIRKEVGLTKEAIEGLTKKAEKMGLPLKNYMEYVLTKDSRRK